MSVTSQAFKTSPSVISQSSGAFQTARKVATGNQTRLGEECQHPDSRALPHHQALFPQMPQGHSPHHPASYTTFQGWESEGVVSRMRSPEKKIHMGQHQQNRKQGSLLFSPYICCYSRFTFLYTDLIM